MYSRQHRPTLFDLLVSIFRLTVVASLRLQLDCAMSTATLHIPEPLKRLQVYHSHDLLSSFFTHGIPLPPSLEVIAAVETVTSRIDWDDPISRIWEVMFRLQVLDQAKNHHCPILPLAGSFDTCTARRESESTGTNAQTTEVGGVVGRQAGKRILADLAERPIEAEEMPTQTDSMASLVEPLTAALEGIRETINRSALDIDTILTQNDRTAMQVAALSSHVVSGEKTLDQRLASLLSDTAETAQKVHLIRQGLSRSDARTEKISKSLIMLMRKVEVMVHFSKKKAKKTSCRRCLTVYRPVYGPTASKAGSVTRREAVQRVCERRDPEEGKISERELGWMQTLWTLLAGGLGESCA